MNTVKLSLITYHILFGYLHMYQCMYVLVFVCTSIDFMCVHIRKLQWRVNEKHFDESNHCYLSMTKSTVLWWHSFKSSPEKGKKEKVLVFYSYLKYSVITLGEDIKKKKICVNISYEMNKLILFTNF